MPNHALRIKSKRQQKTKVFVVVKSWKAFDFQPRTYSNIRWLRFSGHLNNLRSILNKNLGVWNTLRWFFASFLSSQHKDKKKHQKRRKKPEIDNIINIFIYVASGGWCVQIMPFMLFFHFVSVENIKSEFSTNEFDLSW